MRLPDIDFVPFPKISRYDREVTITEKLDGTNAQVYINDDCTEIHAGSRTRWIVPGNDNFGFAAWVSENKKELLRLGPGSHFGEWWGKGIQRGYGLTERRFSLFNTFRWTNETKPVCCHIIPILWNGRFSDMPSPEQIHEDCFEGGSVAAPGFDKPEGIVIFHHPSNGLFKYTFDKNDVSKGRWGD